MIQATVTDDDRTAAPEDHCPPSTSCSPKERSTSGGGGGCLNLGVVAMGNRTSWDDREPPTR
jgi:hypothetical protein